MVVLFGVFKKHVKTHAVCYVLCCGFIVFGSLLSTMSPQELPRKPLRSTQSCQGHPRASKEPSRTPKDFPRSPRELPRSTQEPPRSTQERPRSPKKPLGRRPGALKGQNTTAGNCFPRSTSANIFSEVLKSLERGLFSRLFQRAFAETVVSVQKRSSC